MFFFFFKYTVRLFKYSQRKRKQTRLMQKLLCSSTRVATQRLREVAEQFVLLDFDLSCTFSHTVVHSSNPESACMTSLWHLGECLTLFSANCWLFYFPPSCDCALLPPQHTPTVSCSVFLNRLTFCFSFLSSSWMLWFSEHWLSDAPLCRYSV